MKLNGLASSAILSLAVCSQTVFSSGNGWFSLGTEANGSSRSYEADNPGCFEYNGATQYTFESFDINQKYFLVQYASNDQSCQWPIACSYLVHQNYQWTHLAKIGLFENVRADYKWVNGVGSDNFVRPPYKFCKRYDK